MIKRAFARRLRMLRKQSGISQVTMAAGLDVARQTYLDLEYGKTEPRLSTVYRLAHLLGVPPVTLLLPKEPAITQFVSISEYSTEVLIGEVSVRLKKLEAHSKLNLLKKSEHKSE